MDFAPSNRHFNQYYCWVNSGMQKVIVVIDHHKRPKLILIWSKTMTIIGKQNCIHLSKQTCLAVLR